MPYLKKIYINNVDSSGAVLPPELNELHIGKCDKLCMKNIGGKLGNLTSFKIDL